MTYSEETLDLAQKNALTVIGTSDIRGLVEWQYDVPEGGHRPILLVFGEDRSIESIKRGLFAGRTVAWYYNILVGNEAFMNPLIDACLKFESKGYFGHSTALEIEITNTSDARFMLFNESAFEFYEHSDLIEVQAHSSRIIKVLTESDDSESIILDFKAMNAIVGKKKNA